MLERLQELFKDITGKEIEITPNTKLKNKDLAISSYSLIQLICAIEDEFDIEIPNSQIKKFKTVKDVISFIEKETQ
ncbi:MAG: acyl carrier protein [Clostridia bacterium]|nr:acyl carrier protein [Clostridia bacterium]